MAVPTPLKCNICQIAWMEGDPKLGSKFAQRRRELGLKQLDVAMKVGISRPHLSNIETGKDMPGRQTLIALAATLSLSLDFIAAMPGETPDGAALARTESEALMLFAMRRIPPDEAEMLVKLVLARAGSTMPGDT